MNDQSVGADLVHHLVRDLPALLPEASLILLFFVALLQAIFFKNKSTTRFAGKWYAVALLFIAILTAYECNCRYGTYFSGTWTIDLASVSWVVLMLCTAGLIWLFAPEAHTKSPYFSVIIVSMVLGAMLLAYASHLLLAYLSLELLSIASYLLLLLPTRDGQAERTESAIKFFIQGASGSAIMLFGFSILFVSSGSLHYAAVIQSVVNSPDPLILTGFVLSLAGFVFKLSMWPLHWWVPDVYQSGSITVVLLFSTLSKIAGVAAAYRYLHAAQLTLPIQLALGLFAVVVMTLGNLGAFKANQFRRMMAFSSIAQSGFLWLALTLAKSEYTVAIVLFYLAALVLGKWLAWSVYSEIEPIQGTIMSEWSFKNTGFVRLGVLFLIALMSLTGLPLTMGFFAKFFIMAELSTYLQGPYSLMWGLVLFATIFNTLPALFYYLRPFYFGFMKNGQKFENQSLRVPLYTQALWIVLAGSILYFFFFPGAWF